MALTLQEEADIQFFINKNVEVYASIVATEGLSEENRTIANDYLNKLLKAQKGKIDKLVAQASGIITS